MKISLQGKGITINEALREWVTRKLSPLAKLHKDLEEKETVEVELEKTRLGQRKGRIFRAEAQFMLGNNLLRAEARREDVREAVLEVRDQLEKRLRRFKGRRERRRQNGARRAKEKRF